MKNLEEIRKVKASVEEEILKRKGVTGVDVGAKLVKNQRTDEIAIRVFVEEKKKVVPKKERIPSSIQGVKTDVIERSFEAHRLRVAEADLVIHADRAMYDPLAGGISLGPCRSVNGHAHGGTLGGCVTDNGTGAKMFLSTFHVMCVDRSWTRGDSVVQPSRPDGGQCPGQIVGTVERGVLDGTVDAAVAWSRPRDVKRTIVDIGEYTGVAQAATGMKVRKRGRTTALTHGIVDSIDLTVRINYGSPIGVLTFTDQIGIDVDTSLSSVFGEPGDSGALVVDEDRKVVGLYFAGATDGSFGVASPIQKVLAALDVSLCVVKLREKLKEGGKEVFKEGAKEVLKEAMGKEAFGKGEAGGKGEFVKEGVKECFKGELDKSQHQLEKGCGTAMVKEAMGIPEGGKGLGQAEKAGIDFPPWGGEKPGEAEELLERMKRLEESVGELKHFIDSELRPEMSFGALHGESDIDEARMDELKRGLKASKPTRAKRSRTKTAGRKKTAKRKKL